MQKRIKEHLAEYKLSVLRIFNNGIWKQNNKQYAHILPENQYLMNLIEGDYHANLCTIANSIKRHCDFHHLNSSQALAINLFGPMQSEKDFSRLYDNGIEVSSYTDSRFEYEQPDGTIFDFYINNGVKNIYFEVKYTEETFGTKSKSKNNDSRWTELYDPTRDSYKTSMDKILKDNTKAKDLFFSQYQLWRNIVRISNNDTVVFVFPASRKDLEEEVKSAIEEVKPEYANSIKILHIDDICKSGENHDKLSSHYAKFREKYLEF